MGSDRGAPTDQPRDEDGLVTAVESLLDALADPGRSGALAPDEHRRRVVLARRLEGTAAVVTARSTAALADAGAFAEDGATDATAWLRRTTGRSARDASRVARLSSSVDELPGTAAALADGRLTTESADQIVRTTRATTLGAPDAVEASLLPVATADGATPEGLRAEVRRREQAADGASLLRDENRHRARRRVSLTHRDDGMWDLYGLLPNEAGDRLRTLLDVHDHPDPADTAVGGRRRPDQRLADALDAAVGVAMDHGSAASSGGVARPHVAVHVDLATFDADLSRPDDPNRPAEPDDPRWARLSGGALAWGGELSPQAVRRLCCDAGVSRIVTAGSSRPLDVGRETRTWSPAQRRAVNARDGHCRGPSCDRPIGWTQVHHLRWWRDGGTTDVDNGLALCTACHHLVHDRGWHVVLDPASAIATWTSPDGQRELRTEPPPWTVGRRRPA